MSATNDEKSDVQDRMPGCAAGYLPELNVLCGIADYSSQSGQPVTRHLTVEIIPSPPREQ